MSSASPQFDLKVDAASGIVRLRYIGRVTVDGVRACGVEVDRLLPTLRRGFTVLTDLSALESMELDCVPHLTRIMDVSRAGGVATVVRVIPDPSKDIGLNILSIIHYRRDVRVITCETLAEAERVLTPAAS
jgi:hypothetical protein